MINVYRIGVHLALQDGVSRGLGVIAGHMLGLQRHISGAEMGFNRVGLAIAGAGAAFAGAGLLRGMAALSEHGEKYVHTLAQIRDGMNFTPAQVVASERAARQTSTAVQTTSASDNLQQIRELVGVFNGDVSHAIQYLTTAQKAQAVLSSTMGGSRHSEVYDMFRSAELRGWTNNEAQTTAFVEGQMRAAQALGGRVTPAMFHTAFRRMGPALATANMEYLTQIAPTLINEMTAPGFGTASSTLYNAMIGGHATKAALKAQERYGLRRGGRLTPEDATLLQQNTYEWVQQRMLPAFQRAGVNIRDEAALTRAIMETQSNPRAANLIRIMAQQGRVIAGEHGRIEGDRSAINRSAGLGAFDPLMRNDPVLARQAVAKQWEFAMEMIGKAITPSAIKIMLALANGLNALGNAAAAHPRMVQVLGAVVAGLGVALVVIGALAIGAAAIAAIGGGAVAGTIVAIGVGLGVLAGAVVALGNIDWSYAGTLMATWGRTLFETLIASPYRWLRDQLSAIDWLLPWRVLTAAVSNGWQALTERVDQAVAIVAAWSPALGGAIEAFRSAASNVITAIVDWIKGIPGRIMEGLTGSGSGSGSRGADDPSRNALVRPPGASGYYRGDAVDPDAPARSPFVPQSAPAPAPQPATATPVSASASPWEGGDAATSRETVIRVPVMLDGRQIYEAVTRHQERDLSRPARSGAGFDSRMALPGVEQV